MKKEKIIVAEFSLNGEENNVANLYCFNLLLDYLDSGVDDDIWNLAFLKILSLSYIYCVYIYIYNI